MKKLFLLLIAFYSSVALSVEINEKQMLSISKKIVEETLVSSKLSGQYKETLRKHLEGVMYNEQVIGLLAKLSSENSSNNAQDSEKYGFNLMSGIREKSLLTLSTSDAYELLNLNIQLMSVMTDFECAQYVKKKRTDEGGLGRSVYELSGQLNFGAFKKYINFYDKAFQNLLSNKNYSSTLTPEELAIVKSEFREGMADMISKKPFVKEFFASGKSFSESSDADVCRVSKELLNVVVAGDKERAKKKASAYLTGQLY